MCDVLVALSDATKDGSIIFGKNSDRPADECQVLYFSEGGKRKNRSIRCSYVTLPDTKNRLATMGCRPYWCWGYETGVNEAGVVGGNTAVFTHPSKYAKAPGLTGMDLLRLGLERGDTAEAAVRNITELLEHYGQWGSGVVRKGHEEGSYNNSFLLADKKEAWVLETANKRWVAERLRKGVRSISNELSITNCWTEESGDIKEYAARKKWWDPKKEDFNFAFSYSNHETYPKQVTHIRRMRTADLMERNYGKIDEQTMMNILRDHYEDTFLRGPQFHPFLPDFHTVCMHDSPAGFTWGNTATSAVVSLDPKDDPFRQFWLCYLPPCSGIYLAYPFSPFLPEIATNTGRKTLRVFPAPQAPRDRFSKKSLWWRFNRILKAISLDPLKRRKEWRRMLDPIERENLKRMKQLLRKPAQKREKERDDFIIEQIDRVLRAVGRIEKEWKLS